MSVVESSIVAQYGGSIQIPLFISPTTTRKNSNLINSSFWTTYADIGLANNAWTADRPVGPLTWHSDSANGPPVGTFAYQCSYKDWLFWNQGPSFSAHLFWGQSVVGANIVPTGPNDAGSMKLAVAGSVPDYGNFAAPLSMVTWQHEPWAALIMQCSNPFGGSQNALQYSLFNPILSRMFNPIPTQTGEQGVIFNSGAVSNPITVNAVVPDFINDVNYIFGTGNLYPTDIFTITKNSVSFNNGEVIHGSFDDSSLNVISPQRSVAPPITAFRDGYIFRAFNANGGRTILLKKDGSVYVDLALMPQDSTAAGIVNYYKAHYNLTSAQLSIDAGDGFAYLMDAQTNGTGNPNAILTSFGLNLILNPAIVPVPLASMPLPCLPWGC